MSTDEPTYLDGNAAAGDLQDAFAALDLTTAVGRCAACGRTEVLALARVYERGPGIVLRCSGCESVLVRVVRGADRTWLDLQGVAFLQLATPAG